MKYTLRQNQPSVCLTVIFSAVDMFLKKKKKCICAHALLNLVFAVNRWPQKGNLAGFTPQTLHRDVTQCTLSSSSTPPPCDFWICYELCRASAWNGCRKKSALSESQFLNFKHTAAQYNPSEPTWHRTRQKKNRHGLNVSAWQDMHTPPPQASTRLRLHLFNACV